MRGDSLMDVTGMFHKWASKSPAKSGNPSCWPRSCFRSLFRADPGTLLSTVSRDAGEFGLHINNILAYIGSLQEK